MKGKMKKVTASVMALLLTFAPLQRGCLAESGTYSFDDSHICSNQKSTVVCARIGNLENKLKAISNEESIFQKIWHWFRPTEEQNYINKVLPILHTLAVKQKSLGQTYTPTFIEGAVEKAADAVGGGGLLSWLGSRLSSIFNSYAFNTLLIFGGWSFLTNLYKSYQAKKEAGKVEMPVDPVTSMHLLDMHLASVKGQEKAKKAIRQAVLNIVDKNSQFALRKNSKRAGAGATVIYMIGPSGVGKPMIADICRVVLAGSGATPLVIAASDIARRSRMSPVEQLFGMRTKRTQNGGETYEYSPIIQRLKAVPNTVVIINEYDKVHSPDLDEKLRTIMDQGYINVNGEKIDCSAATFIITSNESSASANKGNLEIALDDDGTGSRTFISHDKSFLNRVKLIELENLSAKEYKEIAMRPFAELAARYHHQYGIDLAFGDTLDSLAQKVEELNRGARPIFNYVESLNDKLLNEVVLNNLNNTSKRIKLTVSFDKKQDEFFLEEPNKKVQLEQKQEAKANGVEEKSQPQEESIIQTNEEEIAS